MDQLQVLFLETKEGAIPINTMMYHTVALMLHAYIAVTNAILQNRKPVETKESILGLLMYLNASEMANAKHI